MSLKISTYSSIWSSVEFLKDILRNSEHDDSITVSNVTSKAATAKGDNYLSDMIRVSVEYTRDKEGRRVNEKKSLIFKMSLNGDGNDDMAHKLGAFEKEIDMMDNTLVKMNEILNDKDHRLSARVLHTKNGNPSFLVLEDLAELGFIMADRRAGLDLQHCLIVMRQMAKFHASSVAIYEKNPNSIVRYRQGIFHEECPEELKKFCIDSLIILGNEAVNWTELDPCYSEKLLKLSKVCFDKSIECAKSRNDEFNVLNHGDCWVNNMLFRYNDVGKVIDHIFVDFQTCMWGSPAVDILYFLNTSTMDDVLVNHYDTLLDEYLTTLVETMLRLGCTIKPPSAESLRSCLREREMIGLISSSMALPIILIDKSAAVDDASKLFNPDSDYVNPTYKEKRYRNIMVRRLKAWNTLGLLDV